MGDFLVASIFQNVNIQENKHNIGGMTISWDYNEYTKLCPCGKGLIKVIDGSNDWGQTSHDETILCLECRKKDELEKAAKEERRRIANHKIAIVLD